MGALPGVDIDPSVAECQGKAEFRSQKPESRRKENQNQASALSF
jgi:hypothetical protein